MLIYVAGQEFSLKDSAIVIVDGYDLEIKELGFDEKTSKCKSGRFINKPIALPASIQMQIKMTSLEPCSGLYEDASGNLKFTAYYD